jgi:DNA-binding NtrC family response regulator
MVGESSAVQRVYGLVESVAPTDTTVLILGESGTGKELVARAIHRRSARANAPFVAMNSGALTESMVDSELFGHVKGSFTGANANRKGLFEVADGGTLFFDEIGELPFGTQTRLLRALQEGEIRPVGANVVKKVNVRVIAATHRNLMAAQADGTFRQDLYYRLNVIGIDMPPLRERLPDLPALVHHFMEKYSERSGKQVRYIDEEALERLGAHPWPGNIRELENAIERAVVLAKSDRITAALLPPGLGARERPSNDGWPLRGLTLQEVEREHIARTLEETNGQIAGRNGAAELLGLNSSTLRSRMQKLGLHAPTPRRGAEH